MLPFVPLPLVDDFLRPYSVGQVLFVVFVLSVVGTLVVRSRKAMAANLVLFGLVFTLTPGSLAEVQFRFLGFGLVVVGPVLYMTASE